MWSVARPIQILRTSSEPNDCIILETLEHGQSHVPILSAGWPPTMIPSYCSKCGLFAPAVLRWPLVNPNGLADYTVFHQGTDCDRTLPIFTPSYSDFELPLWLIKLMPWTQLGRRRKNLAHSLSRCDSICRKLCTSSVPIQMHQAPMTSTAVELINTGSF